MTLLAVCVTTDCRRSSADQRLEESATNMDSTGEVVISPADASGDPVRRCLQSAATPSPPRVSDASVAEEDVDERPTGNGNSFAPPDELGATPVTRSESNSSPTVGRDAKAPVLSFSVAAIMAKSTSPPVLRTQSVVELHNNSHRHRRRQDCPISPVSPLAASPRRASAFTVDGILNGSAGRTSSRSISADDDADDSSCSAADDSESNRSSPGVARSYPPPTSAAANAAVAARQNLPFLHPAGATIDVPCKWPPAGCPYPWQYVNPPSESLVH